MHTPLSGTEIFLLIFGILFVAPVFLIGMVVLPISDGKNINDKILSVILVPVIFMGLPALFYFLTHLK